MSEQTIYANPFKRWAELLRAVRQAFLREMGIGGESVRLSPALGEFLGATAGIVNDCDDAARLLDTLERADADAFAAFQRAMEKTP
jgi:hypothetical protein